VQKKVRLPGDILNNRFRIRPNSSSGIGRGTPVSLLADNWPQVVPAHQSSNTVVIPIWIPSNRCAASRQVTSKPSKPLSVLRNCYIWYSIMLHSTLLIDFNACVRNEYCSNSRLEAPLATRECSHAHKFMNIDVPEVSQCQHK
jgi:hypothetical protein